MDVSRKKNTINTWELNYCSYCGKKIDKNKIYGGQYCSWKCMDDRDEYQLKITNKEYKGTSIFCGCPMTVEKNWVIPDYLSALAALEYPKKEIHLGFLINYPENDSKLTKEAEITEVIMDSFIHQFGDDYKAIDVWIAQTNFEESARIHGRNFNSFSAVRNEWLDMRNKADNGDRYIYSVDSDILLPPYALSRKMKWVKEQGYDAVAGLLSNGPTQEGGEAYNFMSILENELHYLGDRVYIHRAPGMLEVHAEWSSTPNKEGLWELVGLQEVPMTGANMLFKREILDAGTKYGYQFQGEDCYFAEKARDRGFRMYVDFAVVPHHVMNPGILQQIKKPPLGFVVKPPEMDKHLVPSTDEKQTVKVVDKW